MARTTILRGISMNLWAWRHTHTHTQHIRYLGTERSMDINREMPDKMAEKIRVAPRINNVRGMLRSNVEIWITAYKRRALREGQREKAKKGEGDARNRDDSTLRIFGNEIHSSETPIEAEIYFPSLDGVHPPSGFFSRWQSTHFPARTVLCVCVCMCVFVLPLQRASLTLARRVQKGTGENDRVDLK